MKGQSSKVGSLLKSLLILSLFPLFFILHGYNENFGLVSFSTLALLFLKYFSIATGIFLLSLLLFKLQNKAFVFTFYCLTIYFFFGFIHDFVSHYLQGSFFVSYKFILPFILLITSLILFLIKRSKNSFSRLSLYVSILLLIFTVIEVVTFSYKILTDADSKNNLIIEKERFDFNQSGSCFDKPDIFFIVFDEYASTEGLKKFFDNDNSRIDSTFISNGFYISEQSRSNYNFTPFSLASTLNCEYLDLKRSDSLFSNTRLLQGIETFRKNRLTEFLKEQGYEIQNYGCFDLEGTESTAYTDFEWLPRNMIDKQTLSSRFRDDIGWQLQTKNIFTGESKIPRSYWDKKKKHIARNEYNLNALMNELKTSDSKPRFVYAHLMLPHEPYYFDSLGNFIDDTLLYQNRILPEVGYFNQLKYCNRILAELIKLVVGKSDRKRVVIIEGDHGCRFHNLVPSKEMEFYNLNAYYFSDGDYRSLYKSISPVNSFRVVLNKYFCGNLPLLNDSSFYMKQKGRY